MKSKLSIRTLMMAIQAVDAEIGRIQDSVGGDISELKSDDAELLFSYSLAEMELKTAYIEAKKGVSNFPPYEKLIRMRT